MESTSYTSTFTQTITSDNCNANVKRTVAALNEREVSPMDAVPIIMEKRTVTLEKRVNLPALSAFAASQLSSGCSCLNIKPKSTVTTTSVGVALVSQS
jgi:hypothetical protein